jgi:hypothetical protein
MVEIQSGTGLEAPPYYGFITAWYSKSGKLDSWSAPPAAPYGSSLDELKGDISLFKRAFERDLLSNSTFDVEFGPPFTEVPDLVIHRTNYPKRENAPADEPAEEDFKFTIIRHNGVEEPFVPTADSIHLLRRIIEEMDRVLQIQQASTD